MGDFLDSHKCSCLCGILLSCAWSASLPSITVSSCTMGVLIWFYRLLSTLVSEESGKGGAGVRRV